MINKVTLVGIIGKEPTIKNEDTDKEMVGVSLATSESRLNPQTNEWEKETTWHNITAFGNAAKALKRVGKGDTVYVEGKIKITVSQEKTYISIPATIVKILHKKGDGTSTQSQTTQTRSAPKQSAPVNPKPNSEFDDNSDLPF